MGILFSKKIKIVLLPTLFFSLLFSSTTTLFKLARESLLFSTFNINQIPPLKVLSIIPQILLVAILLIFSKRSSFDKIFRKTLIILTVIISLLIALIMFRDHIQLYSNVKNSLNNTFPSGIYASLIPNWPSALFYIVSSIFNFSFFSVLIWGFINRIATISDGIRYYIPLAFVVGISAILAMNLLLLFVGGKSQSLISLAIPAIILIICTIPTFNWAWKKASEKLLFSEEDEDKNNEYRFPVLTGSYLLAGALLAKSFLLYIFKSQIKTGGPSSFASLMGSYAATASISTIIISILWLMLGSFLILKKGWYTAAMAGSLSILIGGLIFLVLKPTGGTFLYLKNGIYSGILIGTTTALFFPLIQMIYLYLPSQNRFKAKVITEMIALPIMNSIPSYIFQGLIILTGSIAASTIYFKTLILICILLLVGATKLISYKTLRRCISKY